MAIRQAIISQHDAGTALKREEQTLKLPAMYKVLPFSDDYTSMKFVVMTLQQYFSKDRGIATQVMLAAYREGKGMCGLYTRDTVVTKVGLVLTHARQAGHPL